MTGRSPSSSASSTGSSSARTSASAEGVVESVDAQGGRITIAHGPVAALRWPAMTMTFKAPGIDLRSLKPADRVRFEPTADGTITRLERE
nr:copper-binding protein [Lysobacter dokdonensis]